MNNKADVISNTASDADSKTIVVWDPLIRIFHWSLVTLFFVAYLSEDDFALIHEYSGYVIVGLIAFRLIWGLIGSKYARFSQFIKSPRTIIAYLKEMKSGKSKRYIGHNPAGGAMIILLLVSISAILVTGIIMQQEIDAQLLDSQQNELSLDLNGEHSKEFVESERFEVLEEVHEFFSNLTLILIFLHVMGVVVSGRLHNENLVKAMIDGKKKISTD